MAQADQVIRELQAENHDLAARLSAAEHAAADARGMVGVYHCQPKAFIGSRPFKALALLARLQLLGGKQTCNSWCLLR